MGLLKRILLWEAAVLAAFGLAFSALPKLILVSLFDQPHYPEYAWIRIAGIQAVGFAMLMVLVAQRLDELWWFSWAFVVVGSGVATVAGLNAALGLPAGTPAPFWWIVFAGATVNTTGLLWGMARAGNERPLG